MKVFAAARTGSDISHKVLALGGVVGPMLYASVVAVLGELYPGYSHLSQTMSELGAADAPHALLMNIAGLGLLGVMIMSFAGGLYQGLRKSRITAVSALVIVGAGMSLVMTAIFPCDTGDQTTYTGQIHGVFATVGAVFMVLGMLILSPTFFREARWRGYAVLTVTVAVLSSVLAGMYGFDVIEGWKGALQRISMGTALIWVEAVSFRLLHLP